MTNILQNIQVLILLINFLSGFFVFTASNPIYSILFLISVFFNSAILIILWGADFLGLLFIIIYVGAIAVLFLFVIMMVNIKTTPFFSNKLLSLILFFFFLLCSIVLYFFYGTIFEFSLFNTYELDYSIYNSWIMFLDPLTYIDIFGQVLYNYYLVCVLVAGLVLLVALIGAIVLTLDFSTTRQKLNQSAEKQLSRSVGSVIFFGGPLFSFKRPSV